MRLGWIMLITALKLKLFSVGTIVSNHIVHNSCWQCIVFTTAAWLFECCKTTHTCDVISVLVLHSWPQWPLSLHSSAVGVMVMDWCTYIKNCFKMHVAICEYNTAFIAVYNLCYNVTFTETINLSCDMVISKCWLICESLLLSLVTAVDSFSAQYHILILRMCTSHQSIIVCNIIGRNS